MVVRVVAIPVAIQALQVEVITLHLLLALLDNLYRPLVEGHGGQAWKRAEALLAAGIAGIDLHGINMHRHAAETTDRIYHEECAMGMGDPLQFFHWLQEAGRSFRDSRGEYFRAWVSFKCLFKNFRLQGCAQFSGQVDDMC